MARRGGTDSLSGAGVKSPDSIREDGGTLETIQLGQLQAYNLCFIL